MSFCSKCGTKLDWNDKFCPECGSQCNSEVRIDRSEVVSCDNRATERKERSPRGGRAIGEHIKQAVDREHVDMFAQKSQAFAKGIANGFGSFVDEVKSQTSQIRSETHEMNENPKSEDIQIVKKPKLSRMQEYAGVVIKCPNCGENVSQMTAVCPLCGHQITGQHSVYSVQAFSEQLMAIESKRKRKIFGKTSTLAAADPVDKQKLELIKNYPIPNTVDDILEFMLLAISNIDVNLSKKRWNKPKGSQQLYALEMPLAISDAWVNKMEQVYQKATCAFPNNPAFSRIESIYKDKMKELKYIK